MADGDMGAADGPPCLTCRGTGRAGSVYGHSPEYGPCDVCGGTGEAEAPNDAPDAGPGEAR